MHQPDEIARAAQLLWGQPRATTRGPRPGTDTDQIVEAAVALADRDGIDAVTMRSLAGQLGLTPMALYPRVGDKATLVALMADRVLGDLAATRPAPTRDWRHDVRQDAIAAWELHRSHLWLLTAAGAGGPMGPNELALHERQLAVLEPLRDAAVSVHDVVAAIGSYVRGALQTAQAAATHRRPDVAAAAASAFREVLQPEVRRRYPHLDAMGALDALTRPPGTRTDHTDHVTASFERGLDLLLDGIERAC